MTDLHDPVTDDRADAEPSIGARLKHAREEQGWSVSDVAQRLRVPHHIVSGLESGEHSRLGAPVFVRGHLRNYARLVGVPVDLTASVAAVKPAELVAMAPSTRMQRAVENMGRRALYVVLTAVLVVPAFLIATQGPDAPTRVSLDAPVETRSMVDSGGVGTRLELGEQPSSRPALAGPTLLDPEPPATLIASIAPFRARVSEEPTPPQAPVVQSGSDLVLRFRGESWVEVLGHDGERIEQSIRRDGDELRFPARDVGRVTLGNVGAVEVVAAGERVDTTPFSRANVARFAVSSDGRIAASGG